MSSNTTATFIGHNDCYEISKEKVKMAIQRGLKKINIQILVTPDEYDILQKNSNEYGLTVPLYIKGEMLQNNDFGTSYRKLIEKVEALPSGTRFNIKSLFGVEWTMSKGIKLNLGKTYFSRVSAGIISNAKVHGKDSSNVMWYEKI